jgi:hypothetical protein
MAEFEKPMKRLDLSGGDLNSVKEHSDLKLFLT